MIGNRPGGGGVGVRGSLDCVKRLFGIGFKVDIIIPPSPFLGGWGWGGGVKRKLFILQFITLQLQNYECKTLCYHDLVFLQSTNCFL